MNDDNSIEGRGYSSPTIRGDLPQAAVQESIGYSAPTLKEKPEEPRPLEPSVGDRLVGGRYTVLAELGRGGMGIVYRCLDNTAGVEVAVKALPPLLSGDSREMLEVKDNFQLVHSLVHQNIADMTNLERDDRTGDYYLVMELVEGEDLRETLRRARKERGSMPPEEALPILRQVADALDFAHGHKVMHRDVKPANIMLMPDGNVKVMDFGLAAQIHTSLSHVSRAYRGTSGTQAYMAPEQWRGKPQGAAADQYALAVMAYEMLSGHLPFDAADADVLKKAVLEESADPVEGLSDSANRALRRALSKNPADRFPNCTAFIDALAGAKASSLPSGNANIVKILIASFVIIAMLFIGYLYWHNHSVEKSRIEAEKVERQKKADAEAAAGRAAEERAAETLKRLKDDVGLLRGAIVQTKPIIELNNYDRGQAFGEHLDKLSGKFADAEKIISDGNGEESYRRALPLYKEAYEALQWISKNAPRREKVKSKLKSVEDEQAKAKEECGSRLYIAELATAGTQFDNAVRLYNDGQFDDAESSFSKVRDAYMDIFRKARAENIGALLEQGGNALHANRLGEARDAARRILQKEPDNNDARNLERQIEARASENSGRIKEWLDEAQRNSYAHDWEKVQEAVDKVIALEPENSKAKELRKQALSAIEKRRTLNRLLTDAQQAMERQEWETAKACAGEVLRTQDADYDDRGKAGKIMNMAARFGGKTLSVELPKGGRLEMIKVYPGSFTMGSPEDEPGRDNDEVRHRVTLTKEFWLGTYEVTYGQWKKVMGTDLKDQVRKALNDDTIYPYLGNKTLRDYWGLARDADPMSQIGNQDDGLAMHYVSYEDCLEFCRRLNEQEKAAGRLPPGYEYTLPTEAQWEYACRAGTTTALYNGPIDIKGECNAPALDGIAWYGGNSSKDYVGRGWDTSDWKEKQYPGELAGIREVGKKAENPWGFHDMIGNVYEWCLDWYGNYGGEATDPKGAASGSFRVCRGGGWSTNARRCRSAGRPWNDPSYRHGNLGFRLALAPVQ